MKMEEGSTCLASNVDLSNQSDISSDFKPKKKSKTLNRLRKLKKTNGTISPTTGLTPHPPANPDDGDLNSFQGSLSNHVTHKNSDVNIVDGDHSNLAGNNEISTPVKVNSAFVANVSFGGSPHRPSPPPKITDGKSSITDKPRPVPRRRIVTPPLSNCTAAVNEVKTEDEKHRKTNEPVLALEDNSEHSLTDRKYASTYDIKERPPVSKPLLQTQKTKNFVDIDKHENTDNKSTESVKTKPVLVFDSATGKMVATVNKPLSSTLTTHVSEDDSSDDDLVIPVFNKKSFKTSAECPQKQKELDNKENDQVKEKLSLNNESQNLSTPVMASTPLKTPLQAADSFSKNGNIDKSDSDDDDVIVVSMAHRNKKRTNALPAVNSSETPQLVVKQDSKTFPSPSPVVVKEVMETESAFIVKPQIVEPEQHNPSQESGVESDRSSFASVTEDDESNQPGPSSLNNKLPPIHSKHALPPLPQNISLRTSYKLDDKQHLRDGERSSSVPFSEPVMGMDDTLSMTNRSFMSTGALSTLTTKALKNRSYLSGGLQSANSLLGKEELERYFPDRQLKIFMATWNMHNEKEIPSNLEDLLLPDDTVFVQDIYAIGTQESCPEKLEWEVCIQQVLGPTHVLLHSASHGVLNLLIFIRRDLIWFCSPIEEDRVSTRVGSMIKTKGAMAVAFNFFGTSLLFVASHFTSGDEKLKERLLDYEKVITTLQLPVKGSPIKIYNKSSTDATAKFDCVFWCGDFNFRIDLPKERVEKWITNMKKKDEPNFNKLLKEDQLIKEMKKKEVFKHFKEGDIQFFPTYKFDLNTDNYDTSPKSRVPSYTDRILFRSRKAGDVTCHVYNSCETIKISDHRAVYGAFTVKIRPGRHDMPTGGGQFARNVFMEGNKRRVEALRDQKASSVCVIL